MCREAVIIERTLEAALKSHYAKELRSLRDRVSRLESSVQLLARAMPGNVRDHIRESGRTRPRVI